MLQIRKETIIWATMIYEIQPPIWATHFWVFNVYAVLKIIRSDTRIGQNLLLPLSMLKHLPTCLTAQVSENAPLSSLLSQQEDTRKDGGGMPCYHLSFSLTPILISINFSTSFWTLLRFLKSFLCTSFRFALFSTNLTNFFLAISQQ